MISLNNLHKISEELKPYDAKLVAVSKTKTVEEVLELYHAGQKIFGENKVRELCDKHERLPKNIEWHLIGHLQTNKVKFIAPFVSLIHSVDSLKLLQEINKQGEKNNRIINCLLQIHIAREETKFGLSEAEAEEILYSGEIKNLKNVSILGLMGMATNMEDRRWKIEDGEKMVRNEFKLLHSFFLNLKSKIQNLKYLSMGMSSDYKIALEQGSNLIRVGSLIFGERN